MLLSSVTKTVSSHAFAAWEAVFGMDHEECGGLCCEGWVGRGHEIGDVRGAGRAD